MEAPEKIYLLFNRPYLVDYAKLNKRRCEEEVEYIRTDALIDRVAIWFNNNFMIHDEYGVISDSFDTKEEMYEDFKNYIKGE